MSKQRSKKYRVSKAAKKAHKNRALKRKQAFDGLAAFCMTNPPGAENKPRMGRLG